MRINDIIEVINKCLASDRAINNIQGNGYFVTHTNWERKMGPAKFITTCINFVNNKKVQECIKVSETVSCMENEILIYEENVQLKALKHFFDLLLTNYRKFLDDTYKWN